MSSPGTPSFAQLQVLLAVADAGSFAAAARRLGRATSAITYAIDNLEAQLGLPLFDRIATRKPELTQAGRAVLAEARAVTHGVDMLRAKVKGLLEGLEAEVSLAVDVMLPTARLVDALQGFQTTFPTVPLRLHVETLGAVTQLVLDGTANIGVSGPNVAADGTESIAIGGVQLVPVAAPSHPLASGSVAAGEARKHLQLVLTDRSPLTAGKDFSVLSPRSWRLADLGAKHALLREGIGWGSMPRHMVEEDLARGTLVELDLPEKPGVDYVLRALWRKDVRLGPAASWALDAFAERLEAS